jgi:phage terminase large subunit-like protein
MLLKPNDGMQYRFAACEADVAFYGGPAGCGKTALLQMESCRFYNNPLYTGIIFRRETTSITLPGGMWETGEPIYKALGAKCNEGKLNVRYRDGGKLKYSHLEHEKNKYNHHGGQYAFIGFDEIQEFTFTQFAYLISRARAIPPCPIRGYVRLTGNADARSWVRQLIDWWIPPPPAKGIPYPERIGVIKHFVIRQNRIIWVEQDYRDEFGNPPLSFTFFGAKLDDNPVDKAWRDDYRRKIASMDDVTRARLGEGDWNAIESGGLFEAKDFEIVDEVPRLERQMRYWDKACTKKKDDNNPAESAGVKGGFYNGSLYITDIAHYQDEPGKITERMRDHAERDGYETAIAWEEEKGADGKYTSTFLQNNVFKGYEAYPDPVSGDKFERARIWAALAKRGLVKLLRGVWNIPFITQAVNFVPNSSFKKDMIDGVSGLHKVLVQTNRVWPEYQYNDSPNDPANNADFYIDFKNTPKDQASIRIFISEEQGSINILFGFWGRKSHKLFIYDEIVQKAMSLEMMILEMAKKAQVKFHNQYDLSVDKIFCEQKLAKGGDDLRKLLRHKLNVFVRENNLYDEIGSIVIVRSLIKANQLLIHKRCTDTINEIRNWNYLDKVSGRPQPGFPLCRALCNIANDLKVMKEIEEPKPPKPYSRIPRMMVDEIRKRERGIV